MKIINNLFDKLIAFIKTNNININNFPIITVTNMSLCHIKDQLFIASFKIYSSTNKNLNMDTRIMYNIKNKCVKSHYKYTITGENCLLGIAILTINNSAELNPLVNIESLDIFNDEINILFRKKYCKNFNGQNFCNTFF